jgi:hypothetical protein
LFEIDPRKKEVDEFITLEDKEYVQDRIYEEHSDSDRSNDDINLSKMEYLDKKIELDSPPLRMHGRRLTAAHLDLLQAVDSEDEDSPLKIMKAGKGRNVSLSPIPQLDRIGLPKVKNYFKVYRHMEKAVD